MNFIKRCDLFEECMGQMGSLEKTLILPVMVSVVVDEEEIISQLAEKLVYILYNDSKDESDSDLLSAKEQCSSSDEDYDKKEGTVAQTKGAFPTDKKLVKVLKKLNTSYNEGQKTVVEAERKANDSVVRRYIIQPECFDF